MFCGAVGIASSVIKRLSTSRLKCMIKLVRCRELSRDSQDSNLDNLDMGLSPSFAEPA